MANVSLDDLRKGDAHVALVERSYALCIRRDLLAEVDVLETDLAAALVAEASEERAEGAPPPRLGEAGPSTRAEEIRQRLRELYVEIGDNTGELRLRAIPSGEWQRWVNDHPARDKNLRDEQVTYGICNAEDLAEALGLWVKAWDDQPLAADDWRDLFATKASGGDLKAMASLVVQMQEAAEDPKWRLRVLLGGQTSNDAAPSPEQ